jgi:PAS domain S-box-containing protein
MRIGRKRSAHARVGEFRALFDATRAPSLLLSPDDPVYTIELANHAYAEAGEADLTGLAGQGLFELFADLPEAESVIRELQDSIRQVLATKASHTIPARPYRFPGPHTTEDTGARYWSISHSPILDEEGEVEFILHQVEDVSELIRLRRIAAESEAPRYESDDPKRQQDQEWFRAISDGTYAYICLLSTGGVLLDCNRAALEFAKLDREDVIGLPFWETPWFAATPGASYNVRQGVALAAAGEFVRYETPVIRPDGSESTFDFSLHPVRNAQGEVVSLVSESRDITERKEAEVRDAFLVGLDDATRPLADAPEITLTAARLLGEHLHVNRCAYADVEEDRDTFNLTGDYNHGVASIVGRYTFTQFGEECLRLMRAGEPYVVEDSETDARAAAVVESYRKTQIRSVICVPLLKSGRFVAAMAVHQTTPRKWKRQEIDLVQRVTSRCWESIERVHVARELRDRERRYRFLAESIPQMVWTALPDGSLEYVNGQGTRYFGAPQELVLGAGWLEWVHPDDRKKTAERWQKSLATGQAYETEFRLRKGSDGSWRWHLARALPWVDESGKVSQWFGTCTDIEAQKCADAELRQQWQTFDTALSHTPDFTYTFDLSGRFTYVNRALLSLWQKPLEEARGKNFFDLGYPTELAARLQDQIQQVIEARQPVRDTTEFTGPTGETRYYEYIFVPVLDASGEVRAVAGSTRDITEQNRAAQQIEEDRRRWRDLLVQTPAAIALLRGPEHRFEWVNPDYQRMVGRSAATLIGKTVKEAIPEVDEQNYLNLLNQVYETGEPHVGHESLVQLDRGDGTLQDWYMNFVYLPTRDVGGTIDGIFVHVTDVTDAVVARKRLEESERQFRTLAETIPHLAWMADESGRVFWFNRRWYDYTGTSFEEIEGRGWQKLHDPKVLPAVLSEWQRAIASGEPFEMVFPLKGADGEFRTFLTRIEPVKDAHGRVARWFGTNTDITEQRRTEEALRRMNRELEEFAYVASHDLQEPLRMVNIYTQLILRNPEGSKEDLAEYAGFVREGVTRMGVLIQDLLTFSKSVHTEDLEFGNADLSAALSQAMAVLKTRITDSGAVIRVSALPLVRGDTSQMSHVFQNLLSNALKYRKPEIAPKIDISVRDDGDQTVVSVRDNGIGFESQYAERIFGLFKRLHKEEYPGTGLGLAICKRIVERYGGHIWADGKLGEGATISFSLPRVDTQ